MIISEICCNCDCNIISLKIDRDISKLLYNEDSLNVNKLTYVKFELKNIGLTEIEEVCISSNNQINCYL